MGLGKKAYHWTVSNGDGHLRAVYRRRRFLIQGSFGAERSAKDRKAAEYGERS